MKILNPSPPRRPSLFLYTYIYIFSFFLFARFYIREGSKSFKNVRNKRVSGPERPAGEKERREPRARPTHTFDSRARLSLKPPPLFINPLPPSILRPTKVSHIFLRFFILSAVTFGPIFQREKFYSHMSANLLLFSFLSDDGRTQRCARRIRGVGEGGFTSFLPFFLFLFHSDPPFSSFNFLFSKSCDVDVPFVFYKK